MKSNSPCSWLKQVLSVPIITLLLLLILVSNWVFSGALALIPIEVIALIKSMASYGFLIALLLLLSWSFSDT